MNSNQHQKGYCNIKPYYIVDKETGEIIELDLPADAIAPEAKPGVKAGNPLLDEINEELRREGLIEKMKKLYKKDKK